MNKLYSLLTYSVDLSSSTSYYVKQCYPPRHTPRSREICDAIMKGIPQDRFLLFACLLCTESLSTEFGEEIRSRDPENTYTALSRDPSASLEAADSVVWDLTKPVVELKYLYQYLDDDIKDKLVVPCWMDIMAAACLQMLREAY